MSAWPTMRQFSQTFEHYRLGLVLNGLLAIVLILVTKSALAPLFSRSDIAHSDLGNGTATLHRRNLAYELNNIMRWDLFGRAPVTDDAQVSSSSLRILGIFMAADANKRSAVIQDGDGPEGLYYVGDRLPGGQRVRNIMADRVIIDNHGTREAVLFDIEAFDKSRLPSTGSSPRPDAPPPGTTRPPRFHPRFYQNDPSNRSSDRPRFPGRFSPSLIKKYQERLHVKGHKR